MYEILLSTSDVSKILGVSARTIRHYIEDGKLKARRIGGRYKVLENEVIQFLNECNMSGEKENE